ncbi:hypothetical protein PF001_g6875 [Phytophthora fragariae]|nr:hypothetical protein PF009_g15545 [Phytophthora fragariae]KAE9001959.1 hypothetical protein PF011_g13513 [Phytophthora fragariae]KAE9317380.1 hypothetical protein PF001_g6875 [Phytophthora fragariae]
MNATHVCSSTVAVMVLSKVYADVSEADVAYNNGDGSAGASYMTVSSASAGAREARRRAAPEQGMAGGRGEVGRVLDVSKLSLYTSLSLPSMMIAIQKIPTYSGHMLAHDTRSPKTR